LFTCKWEKIWLHFLYLLMLCSLVLPYFLLYAMVSNKPFLSSFWNLYFSLLNFYPPSVITTILLFLFYIAAWPPRPFVCYSIKDCPEDFCSHPKVLMCKRFICKCSWWLYKEFYYTLAACSMQSSFYIGQ
jgi:hypothetical protein